MTSAANIVLATNIVASQGSVTNARLFAEASEQIEALVALVETLSTAVGADSPGAPVIAAMAAVDAKMLVVSALCPALSTYLPA
jgi:hypothetical protein